MDSVCGLKIILIILKIIFDLENIIFKNSMQIKKRKGTCAIVIFP
jgi:hypothetical protein